MKWIGIHAAAGSGKDTAADFIVKEFGGCKVSFADPMKYLCSEVLGFTAEQLYGPSENRNAPDQRYAGSTREQSAGLARLRLRAVAQDWLRLVLPHFGPAKRDVAQVALTVWLEDCLRQDGLTPRYALQTLGTEWGRAQDPSMWFLFAEATALKQGHEICVVPDVRFLNEAAFIAQRVGTLIEVLRPNVDGQAAMTAGVAAHASEMSRVLEAKAFREFITHTVHNDDTLDTFKERIWGVLSPEVPWGAKPLTQPLIAVTPSAVTESVTDTPISSPSTSNTLEIGSPPSLLSISDEETSSPPTPSDTPETLSDSGLKATPVKTGGSGPKSGRKS